MDSFASAKSSSVREPVSREEWAVRVDLADAFASMYFLQRACEIQVHAQSGGEPLTWIGERIVQGIQAQVEVVTKGLGAELVWPGLLRRLERIDPSYRD